MSVRVRAKVLIDVAYALSPTFVVIQPKKGSHWKIHVDGKGSYPITCHNAMKTELGEEYVRGLADHLGIPFKTLVGKLRG